jgi:drug/metabolite transporter (DMT)-like permease
MSYAFPVVAVGIDVLIAGERFGTRAWLGSALVLAGVVVAGVRRRAAVPPVSGSPTTHRSDEASSSGSPELRRVG